MNLVQLLYDSFFYTVMRQMKEKEIEDLTSQLRDKDKQNETLKQTLKGNWHTK